jgi:hypothetical protein
MEPVQVRVLAHRAHSGVAGRCEAEWDG